ncbi:MAG: amino acid ABC transporter ATP-binding protein [Campylobacterales bacterium]
MKNIIEFVNVNKSFGDTLLFENLNLCAIEGETLSIIGSSGSGKSTILRMLMTLESIDGGEIYIDGEPMWHTFVDGKAKEAKEAHLKKIRSKLSMVFQQFNLFPHMSVLENITIAPRKVLKLSKDEAEARALELLKKVGLQNRAYSMPKELSGGQKQRVAIARSLAMQPKIMLFDEVTSALDPELVEDVLNVIKDLSSMHSLTLLIVTHEMYFAKSVSDRVAFIDGGEIKEIGAPSEIFNSPKNRRTEEFLSSFVRR